MDDDELIPGTNYVNRNPRQFRDIPGIEWLNTPGWRSDSEVAGKPLHAIDSTGKSLCGLRRKQWISDLMNEDKCLRCLRVLRKREKAVKRNA
jgi:hypothetical protein